ncbi:MAG: hypothetical protein NC097_07470 [Clostridium sp.]|nr:hypothetical protein [Prevotella sp.]MCM1429616.1 hypothetical protein [Clostridium sp.]MCM1476095.1 hypothetical protein [Muribaculaceae bacterium]
MSESNFSIYYSSEDDRAFGLAGMAITLAALDATDRVAEVSIDNDGPMVAFSHEYYFSGSPSISPKATWDNLLQNFHLTTSMVVGNVMARSIVRLGGDYVPKDALDEIRRVVVDEARESCSLEEDEAERLLQRTLTRANRIFLNPRLHPVVKELANVISRRRHLTGKELEEILSMMKF